MDTPITYNELILLTPKENEENKVIDGTISDDKLIGFEPFNNRSEVVAPTTLEEEYQQQTINTNTCVFVSQLHDESTKTISRDIYKRINTFTKYNLTIRQISIHTDLLHIRKSIHDAIDDSGIMGDKVICLILYGPGYIHGNGTSGKMLLQTNNPVNNQLISLRLIFNMFKKFNGTCILINALYHTDKIPQIEDHPMLPTTFKDSSCKFLIVQPNCDANYKTIDINYINSMIHEFLNLADDKVRYCDAQKILRRNWYKYKYPHKHPIIVGDAAKMDGVLFEPAIPKKRCSIM